jgi:hypothetical protein
MEGESTGYILASELHPNFLNINYLSETVLQSKFLKKYKIKKSLPTGSILLGSVT